MPIRVRYDPDAVILGEAAQLAGLGEYRKYREQMAQREAQMGAQRAATAASAQARQRALEASERGRQEALKQRQLEFMAGLEGQEAARGLQERRMALQEKQYEEAPQRMEDMLDAKTEAAQRMWTQKQERAIAQRAELREQLVNNPGALGLDSKQAQDAIWRLDQLDAGMKPRGKKTEYEKGREPGKLWRDESGGFSTTNVDGSVKQSIKWADTEEGKKYLAEVDAQKAAKKKEEAEEKTVLTEFQKEYTELERKYKTEMATYNATMKTHDARVMAENEKRRKYIMDKTAEYEGADTEEGGKKSDVKVTYAEAKQRATEEAKEWFPEPEPPAIKKPVREYPSLPQPEPGMFEEEELAGGAPAAPQPGLTASDLSGISAPPTTMAEAMTRAPIPTAPAPGAIRAKVPKARRRGARARAIRTRKQKDWKAVAAELERTL